MSARIDAHVHLWDRTLDPQDWIDPETMAPIDRDFGTGDLAEMLVSADMERAVVVQSSNSIEESVRLARTDSAVVAGLVAWVDLTQAPGPQLAHIRDDATVPVVGIRHLAHIDPDPEWLLRDDVSRGLHMLAEEGLCFDLVVRDWQLPQAAHLAARHPELQLVLDHLGGPPAPGGDLAVWSAGLRDLARHSNVAAKLSGLVSGLAPGSWSAADLAPAVEVALDAFGPERLLYGSDWPLVRLGGDAADWRSAVGTLLDGLSTDERDGVFGETALSVYSLG